MHAPTGFHTSSFNRTSLVLVKDHSSSQAFRGDKGAHLKPFKPFLLREPSAHKAALDLASAAHPLVAVDGEEEGAAAAAAAAVPLAFELHPFGHCPLGPEEARRLGRALSAAIASGIPWAPVDRADPMEPSSQAVCVEKSAGEGAAARAWKQAATAPAAAKTASTSAAERLSPVSAFEVMLPNSKGANRLVLDEEGEDGADVAVEGRVGRVSTVGHGMSGPAASGTKRGRSAETCAWLLVAFWVLPGFSFFSTGSGWYGLFEYFV